MPPAPNPVQETPSTALALLAGAVPFLSLVLGLIAARLASGMEFQDTLMRAGSFGYATLGAALMSTLLIGIAAFLSGRVVRVPAPVIAAFAIFPALIGAAGVAIGSQGVLDAVAHVNPADKATITFAGWAEASQAAVLGFALAAGCCGGAALSVLLAGLARRSAGNRSHRVALLASAAVLLGGSWVLLLRAVLAGHLAQGYEAVASVNPADKAVLLAAAAMESASDHTLLLGAWVVAIGMSLTAIALTWVRSKQVAGVVTAVLVLGGSALCFFSVDSAQERSDAFGSVMDRPKLLHIEGSGGFNDGALLLSGDKLIFDRETDPGKIADALLETRKRHESYRSFDDEDRATRVPTYWLNIGATATPAGLARALRTLHAAGYEQVWLFGQPEIDPSKIEQAPKRMRLVVEEMMSVPAGFAVKLLEAAAALDCSDCVNATIEGNDLVLVPKGGERKRVALGWDRGDPEAKAKAKALFALPIADLERWVMALSTAKGQQHTPTVLLP